MISLRDVMLGDGSVFLHFDGDEGVTVQTDGAALFH